MMLRQVREGDGFCCGRAVEGEEALHDERRYDNVTGIRHAMMDP